jgi:endonuclease YncB( thermonuclease family)
VKRAVLLFSIITVSLSAGQAIAGKKIYMERITVSEVTSIYDADTFRINIDGWPPFVGERMPVRISGVDAPEIRGKCNEEKTAARKAKQYTVAMLRGAKHIELRNIRRGKYFRLLADVYADGKSIAEGLINAGLARSYDGGARRGWCPK